MRNDQLAELSAGKSRCRTAGRKAWVVGVGRLVVADRANQLTARLVIKMPAKLVGHCPKQLEVCHCWDACAYAPEVCGKQVGEGRELAGARDLEAHGWAW